MPISPDEDVRLLVSAERLPFAIERGEGSHVFDERGERYLDLLSGKSSLVGHAHPRVVRAIREQAGKLIFFPDSARSSVRARALEQLVALAPPNLGRVVFQSSGSEAVETALKIARRWRGRRRIVAFRGSFHGQTQGALSVAGLPPHDRQHALSRQDTVFCRMGAIEEVEAALNGDTAAVLLEPIQSSQGIRVPEPDFVRRVETLCRARGAALILDEVQTAPGRTGERFAADLFQVRPHMITLGHGLAGGLPCAAVLVDTGLAETVNRSDYGSSLAGGALVMAALEATVSVVLEEKLWERARDLGDHAHALLTRIPGVASVRGKGLLVGVQLETPARPVRDALLEERIIVGLASEPGTIRLLPALTADRDVFEELAAALSRVLGRV